MEDDEKETVVLGSESLRFGDRLKSRAVPMFPLKNCGRPKSANAQIQSKISTNNLSYNRLSDEKGKLEIPKYKRRDYSKTAVTRIDTRSNLRYAPSKTSRVHIITNGSATKYSQIGSKVDTADPAPWIHATPKKMLEELAELDGFKLNPRFKGIVESRSFDSVQDILEILDHEKEGPIVKLHRKRAQTDQTSSKEAELGGTNGGNGSKEQSMDSSGEDKSADQ